MDRSSTPGVALVLALLTFLRAEASGQAPTIELADPTCRTCEIVLTEKARLGDPDGLGMLESDYNLVQRDSRGRYYVYGQRPYFWVFDDSGALIDRVGVEGSGPGEFRWISGIIVDPTDSLFVFDPPQGRLTVLGPDYSFARNVNLSYSITGQGRFAGPLILLNEGIRGEDIIGEPLHLLDREGHLVSSFGKPEGVEYRPDLREIIQIRHVAAAGDGTFWVAPINEYLLEHWDTSGHLIETMHRDVEWFPRWTRPEGDAETAPVPVIWGLSVSDGVLYVLVQVPGPEWRSAVRPSGGRYEVTDPDAYRQTILEAIDLGSRTVIATKHVPETLNAFVGPGLLTDGEIDEVGNPTVRIQQLELRR